jgi:hypothetical protein
MGTEVLMPPGVETGIGAVVVEQVEHGVLASRPVQQRVLQQPAVRVDACGVRYAAPGGRQVQARETRVRKVSEPAF